MRHSEVKKMLADYLEGDLSLEARASVDAHLESCSECAAEVDEMLRTIRLLHDLPEPEVPPMITANVMRRIRAGETEPTPIQRMIRFVGGVLEPAFVLPASAVAVAALVAMVVQDPSTLTRYTTGATGEVEALQTASAGGSGLGRNHNRHEVAGIPTPTRQSQRAKAHSSGLLDLRRDVEVFIASSAHPSASSPSVESPSVPFEVRVSESLSPQTRGTAAPGIVTWQSPSTVRSGPSSLASRARGNELGRARRVAQPSAGQGFARAMESSGGADPRDAWLLRGIEEPVDFARFLNSKNLAEHELWVSRLAERALELGILDDLIAALDSTSDVSAAILGDDFRSEMRELELEPNTPSQAIEPEASALGER